LSFVGNSMPNFFVGLLLIYFLALKLNLLPIMGTDWRAVIMPALTLTVSMSAKYTRQIRAVVLEELGKPYVMGARSRGVSEFTILTRSVLRSSLIVIITLLALSMGSLLGGTAIVETIFMWDGVGKLAVDAILTRDYPLIQAYVVWMATIYVVINLIADLLYHWLDPRVGGVER
ncbi:MAG: ABC transporter permease, partial [Selenomonadaceae bacterium]|nr:ABC transporter permease [Selenomonadaceae bacterium]